MAAVNQWGKRSSTDVPVAEPEAQRRRLDVNDSSSNSSSDIPSVTSQALTLSPFEELPGDVVQHLFLQMDRRTQGVMAQCSKFYSDIAKKSHWDKAGSLVENGKLRRTASHDESVFSKRRAELPSNLVSWPNHNEGLNRPASGQAPMTDREIGFWLGCHHSHISLADAATPQLMSGLSMASHWRSLSLTIDLNRCSLSDLLQPLIDELGAQPAAAPRELFLDINGGYANSSLVVPDALWNGRLELVGLDLDGFENLQQILLQFKQALTLRYLSVVSLQDKSIEHVLSAIGKHFPELQHLQLISEESTCVQDKNSLVTFQRDHPWLQFFSLDFSHVDRFGDDPFEFPVLNVRNFSLTSDYFIDRHGKFSDWLATNNVLEELRIKVDHCKFNKGEDFRQFAKAVGVNQSLCTLYVGGNSDTVFDTSFKESPFKQCLVDFAEGVSCNTHLRKLILSFDLINFLQSEHSSKWQIVKHLESLEAVNPGLIFEIADPMQEDSIYCRVFGAVIKGKSAPIRIPANEFVERFGWLSAEQMPSPEFDVEFQVDMPTWGNGAFRKMIGHLSMRDKDKKKLILEGLSDGSLAKESIQVLRIVPKEDSQEEALSDSDEDR